MLFLSASIQSIWAMAMRVVAFVFLCVCPSVYIATIYWPQIASEGLYYSFFLHSFYVLSLVLAVIFCFARYLRRGLLPKSDIKCKELLLARLLGWSIEWAMTIVLLSACFSIGALFLFDVKQGIGQEVLFDQAWYQLIGAIADSLTHQSTWSYVWHERQFESVIYQTLLPILMVPIMATFFYKPLMLVFARMEPNFARALQKRINKAREGEKGLSDIDEEYQAMTRLADRYDALPEKHIKLEKGLMLGFDESASAYYLNWDTFCKTHMSVIGSTGNGKGVATACMLYQCILRDHSICCFDFKVGGDKFMPKVLQKGIDAYNKANNANKQLYIIDLNADLPLLNLIADIDEQQFKELLQNGFNLYYQGKDSDYYRKHDIGVLKQVSELISNADSLPELWSYICKHCPQILLSRKRDLDKDTREELAMGHMSLNQMRESFCLFAEHLESLSRLAVLQTNTGVDLKKAILDGDVLYFIGSRNNADIKTLQRMLTLRITQIIEQTDSLRERQVTCFFDEVKYILSSALTQAVGIIRDKRANMVFNYQEIENLADVSQSDPTLSSRSVKLEILGNCALKLVYGVGNAETRQWASEMTGKSVITTRSYNANTNALAMDIDAGESYGTRKVWQNKYTVNTFAQLPERVGVLMGDGVAKLLFTAYIDVTGIESPVNRQPVALISHDKAVDAPKTDQSLADIKTVDNTPEALAVDDAFEYTDIEDMSFEDEAMDKGDFGRD